MVRPRQPINLLLYKGKKNLTKKEIEERRQQEIKASSDKVKPPSYLSKDLKREFKKIAEELVSIGIMTNLDCDALARFLIAQKMYLQVTEKLLEMSPVIRVSKENEDDAGFWDVKEVEIANETYSELLLMQDKLFKQCRAASSDLGLTISSRCRLVMPKEDKNKEPTEFESEFGGV